MTLTRHTYAIIGLVTILAASGLSASHSRSVAAGATNPQAVLVVNTNASPVPTAAQGTTQVGGTVAVNNFPATQTVAISGTPSVGIAANQTVGISGTPNVAVSNFPATQTVAISGTPNVAVTSLPNVQLADGSAVAINNGLANPVLTRNADAHDPVLQTTNGLIADTQHAELAILYTVPAGKRLVIKDLYFEAAGQTISQSITEAEIEVAGPFTTCFIHAPMLKQGDNGTTAQFSGALTGTSIVVPEGGVVSEICVRSVTTGLTSCDVTFDGYLEDVP